MCIRDRYQRRVRGNPDHTMEAALDALETQFHAIETDLQSVSQRLQTEFESSKSGTNPAGLLKRLREVSKQLPRVRQECDEIFAEKQALVDASKHNLLPAQSLLSDVLVALENEVPEDNSGQALRQSLDQWNRSISNYFASSGQCAPIVDRSDLDRQMFEMAAEQPSVNVSAAELNKENGGEPSVSRPAKKFKSTIVVTQDHFDSLSNTVKGKCSLNGVNELLGLLMRWFAEHPTKNCIRTPELISIGAKIKHAGDKKLSVLRALKMIQLTKSGIALDTGLPGGKPK
eukprot:TRINITY_DN17395_c0_g1_i1.p1 TRINITY_DN17395_c0_g1~~TRINITY_DN17395_c0_g1_i1.p1  ORF type:complete len:287 (-),score=73.01 TRINITY_DN17395_c0_g1_i1:257-1117(-)